jgi:hypothetical protein
MQDDSCQKYDERLLFFKDVYFGIFYAFSMKGTNIKDENGKAISKENAIQALERSKLVAEWKDNEDYAKGFENVQKFFLDRLPDDLIRLKLNSPQLQYFSPDELNVGLKETFLKRTDPASLYLRELIPENVWSSEGELAKALNHLIDEKLIYDTNKFRNRVGKTLSVNRKFLELAIPGLAITYTSSPEDKKNQTLYPSGLSISCPQDSQSTRNGSFPIDVFLFIYPNNNLGILFFNIKLCPSNKLEVCCTETNKPTTDLLIFLIQSLFEDRFEVPAVIPDYLKEFDINDGKHLMGNIAKKYIELVQRAFEINKLTLNIIVPSKFKAAIKNYLKDSKLDIVEETPYECIGEENYSVSTEVPCTSGHDKIDQIRRDIKDRSEERCTLSLDFGNIVKKRILEIREIDNVYIKKAETLLNDYPQQIYGLMVGDEGWRFVTKKFSKLRISHRWGSRDFISILASSVGIILFNFRNTYHYRLYIDTQKKLRNSFNGKLEEYFGFNYDISGLEHGAFFCLEKAVITRFILNQQIDRMDAYTKAYYIEDKQRSKYKKLRKIWMYITLKSHKKFQDSSQDLISLYANLNMISIENKKWEIDVMYNIIEKTMELDKDLDNIKNRLTYHRDTINQYYSIKYATYAAILTWGSLFLAAIGIIIASYLTGIQIHLDENDTNKTETVIYHFYNFWQNSYKPLFP